MTTATWLASTTGKTAHTAPVGSDILRIINGGASKKITLTDLFTGG